MKAFIWLLVIASVAWCLSCWAASRIVGIALTGLYHRTAWPGATELFLFSNSWILFYPVPLLVYATRLTYRRESTIGKTLVFAGIMNLALIILTGATVLACLLPYVELYGHFEP